MMSEQIQPKSQLKSRSNLVGIIAIIISAFIDKIDAFAPYFAGHEQAVMAVSGIVVIALRQITSAPLKPLVKNNEK